MKKLTAMLLSLMMCFSLLAIPAQAALIPLPDGPVIVDAGKGLGKEDPDEPGISVQGDWLPTDQDNTPTD